MKKRYSSIMLVFAFAFVFVLTACTGENSGNPSQTTEQSQDINTEMLAENERLQAEIEAIRLQIEIETLRSELVALQKEQAETQQNYVSSQYLQDEDVCVEEENENHVEETESATEDASGNNTMLVTVNGAHVSSALNMTSSEVREFFGPPYTFRRSYWNGRGDGYYLDFTGWGVYFPDENSQASRVYVYLANVDCRMHIDNTEIRLVLVTREFLLGAFRVNRDYQITEGANDYWGEYYFTVFIGDYIVTFTKPQLQGQLLFPRVEIKRGS